MLAARHDDDDDYFFFKLRGYECGAFKNHTVPIKFMISLLIIHESFLTYYRRQRQVAREGQGDPCWQRDMMMMNGKILEPILKSRKETSNIVLFFSFFSKSISCSVSTETNIRLLFDRKMSLK